MGYFHFSKTTGLISWAFKSKFSKKKSDFIMRTNGKYGYFEDIYKLFYAKAIISYALGEVCP